MPSPALKKDLEKLISSKSDKFDDDFDIEWNIFSSLCQEKSNLCFDRKTCKEKEIFEEIFMKLETKSQRIKFFLEDQHFSQDLNNLFENFVYDCDLYNKNKKSSVVARFFIDSGKRKINNLDKALLKYNLALMYCPYPKDADCETDKLLYAKILLKRSELFCSSFNIQDSLKDIEEGLKILEQSSSEERNILFCKFLFAKSVYLNIINHKKYEYQLCLTKIKEEINKFEFNDFIKDKLANYQNYLIRYFNINNEVINTEFERQDTYIEINELTANSKLPGASTNLELAFIEGKGRTTFTKTEIADNSILYVEKPIISWLRPTMQKSYCNHCLVRVKNHFITCFDCVKVKYCSSNCRDEAWENYHSVECKYQECLRYLGYGHMTLRSLLVFDQDEILKTIAKNFKEDRKKLLKKSYSTNNYEYDLEEIEYSVDNEYWVKKGFKKKMSYENFNSFVGDENNLTFNRLMPFYYGVSFLGLLANKMGLIDENDRFYYILQSAMINHIYKINFNCYSIYDHSLSLNRKLNLWTHHNDVYKVGIGIYLSSSMISHSCDPNTDKVSIGSKFIIYSNRIIEKNEEITHSYGPCYKTVSLKDRQSCLKNGYLFNCECLACLNEWENIFNSFKCNVCFNGPLIFNQDYTNKCFKCNFENQDLNFTFYKINQAQEKLNSATILFSEENWSECKRHLNVCKKSFKSIYYSNQKFKELYFLFMEYYYHKEKYQKAFKYANLLTSILKEKNEKDTFESIFMSIKALSLLTLHLKKKNLTLNHLIVKKNLKKLKNSYNFILEKFIQLNCNQIKLLESDYLQYSECFDIVENFLKSFKIEV